MPSKNLPSQWSSPILKGQMTHLYIALQCSLRTQQNILYYQNPKISLQIHLRVDSEISTNVFLLHPIHSNQSPKAIHVTSRSPRGSHINSPSPPYSLSSIHRYTIQLKFISTNVFLLDTIHSTKSLKAVPLTPRTTLKN